MADTTVAHCVRIEAALRACVPASVVAHVNGATRPLALARGAGRWRKAASALVELLVNDQEAYAECIDAHGAVLRTLRLEEDSPEDGGDDLSGKPLLIQMMTAQDHAVDRYERMTSTVLKSQESVIASLSAQLTHAQQSLANALTTLYEATLEMARLRAAAETSTGADPTDALMGKVLSMAGMKGAPPPVTK